MGLLNAFVQHRPRGKVKYSLNGFQAVRPLKGWFVLVYNYVLLGQGAVPIPENGQVRINPDAAFSKDHQSKVVLVLSLSN